MAEFTVEVKGLDALLKKFGKPLYPYIQAMTMQIGKEVERAMSRPPGPSHQPVIWASEAQRRWWFASRREAGLSFKYARNNDKWSQNLEKAWTTEKRGSMDALVGNKGIGYAGYVQSDAKQTAQHRATGWITDKIALARVKASGVIARMWKDTVANFFSDRGK